MKKIALSLIVATVFVRCSAPASQDKAEKDTTTAINSEIKIENYDSVRKADSIKRLGYPAPQKAGAVTTPVVAAPTAIPASNGDAAIAKGKTLIAGSDCLTCHKLDVKLIGPAYKDVAKKYTQADVQKLAGKVISGGSGNWGAIPMVPHPGLSAADAAAMVEYILSIK